MPDVDRPKIRPWLRPLYFVLALAFLVIGIVGVFLPVIPTTGPLLLAAFLFARSSERMHHWLVNHRRFGRFISDYQSGQGIPRRTKVVAVSSMSAAFIYTIGWVLPTVPLQVAMGAVWAWAAWYVLHLPTADRAE